MLTLELDKKTENRLKKMLEINSKDYSLLFNSIINYRINELRKGISNFEIEFSNYEQKYKVKTNDFYNDYCNGLYGDNSHDNELMAWSGMFETYLEYQNEIEQLQ